MTGAKQLPTGTVTFLVSDIEGSTRLASTLGDGWPVLLDAHAGIVRDAVIDSGGLEVSTEGDSFFCVFAVAGDALRAAVSIQKTLASHPWPDGSAVKVRIGLHTGLGTLGGADYVGLDVHLAARISAAGHGGEVLVSESTRTLISDTLPEGVGLRDLGEHWLRGLDHPVRIYQALVAGLPSDFPPPDTLT
ncbi:MAG TPA: adenylate/guanylate cyclase domain-containing protein, partial [Acidimicrobiia bacterium]|nr:adenylate/guanylate cyclase domain-containing protein [Acidimicrobiia bacterium]